MKLLGTELDDTQAGNLAYIIHSPAWIDTFEPMLRAIEKGYLEDLLSAPDIRPDKPDGYLRAGVLLVRSILELPVLLLEEKRNTDEADQQQKTEDEEYQDRADAGGGPIFSEKGPWDKDFPPELDY